MDRQQRLRQAGRQPPQGRERQRPMLGHDPVQGRTGHERGGQPQRALVDAGCDDRRRKQATDYARRGYLATEPADKIKVTGQFRVDDLDCDHPACW
jgi:hypothetical protein